MKVPKIGRKYTKVITVVRLEKRVIGEFYSILFNEVYFPTFT